MRTTTAAIMIASLTLTGCGIVDSSDSVEPTDSMTFCAQLGARMMTIVNTDESNPPDPARVAQTDQTMQETADRIAATEDEWGGLGNLTRSFLAADDPQTMQTSHAGLQLYCNKHSLSPFPQS
ncbi:hypothetical protein [Streptomyces sp. NPDC057623]|uniref:hypothetical protein n=1 Tax=Streptomyces sp. NPDC057623 TaxID=3346187 RepID=UPI0036C09EEE